MGLVLATTIECLLLSPVNYIRNINFFSYSFFLNIVILCFFSYRYLWWSKNVLYIVRVFSCYFFGICLPFFGVFIRAILEQVCQSCDFYNASPFLFCSFKSIYQSIHLPTSNLPTNLSIRSYLFKFSKGSFISRNNTIYQNHLSRNSDSNKGITGTLLGCVDMYCHQKLLS